MTENNREKIEDKIIDGNLENIKFRNKLFVRVGSKDRYFKNVDFSHTYFEHCYFRKCTFDNCNFNGCKFINSNFVGSSFPGSQFEYATFDKTIVDNDILYNNSPSSDNLTLKFARTLRVNYQALGDAESANKAIRIELRATKEHLYDAWKSNKAYYRQKYSGWKRIGMFFSWFYFKIQEFIWGNGEIPWYLLRTGLLIWLGMTAIDGIVFKDTLNIKDYWVSFIEMPAIFFGIEKPKDYSNLYLSSITLYRLIGFALFMSIILKRFNRR
ncbi:pentapeptide repeat-containing protein [Flavobacterium sp. PL02]|uniref:pentapeptide repeat-containing protein n=1 Tax=Flavobacterium sp. PL02 TaxID=3088354 RepID=UPI002B23BF5A|nr:pentapeptide repeat-containing protein [Flavobacterium sp. PL02]MEA9414300.1 pentapeptide repeat-containing protein [Flavobacterium sp. PL02]